MEAVAKKATEAEEEGEERGRAIHAPRISAPGPILNIGLSAMREGGFLSTLIGRLQVPNPSLRPLGRPPSNCGLEQNGIP